jgi:hypothetical protein
LRKSFEDTESCTSLSALDTEREFNGERFLRLKKIPEYVKRHNRPLAIVLGAVGALVVVCAGVVLSLRIMGITGNKENIIMNLLLIEGDESIRYSNPPQPDGIISNKTTFCGHTPREAQARGCVFDVMSFAWLPPACLETEMMERYISERTWEWYEDYEMTKKLPLSVVRQGEYKWAFSTQSFHIAHCVYTWEKQGRFLFASSREDEKWIDQGSFGHHHTTHCIDFILKRDMEPNKISTIWNGVVECFESGEMGTL